MTVSQIVPRVSENFPTLNVGQVQVETEIDLPPKELSNTQLVVARKLLRLVGDRDVSKIIAVIPIVESYLKSNWEQRFPTEINLPNAASQCNIWIKRHVFMVFIANIFKNACCSTQDVSYRQLECVVTDLAGL